MNTDNTPPPDDDQEANNAAGAGCMARLVLPSSLSPETDALRDSYENYEHRCNMEDLWELCESMERERNTLAAKFTKLDKPKYSGDPMMDSILGTANPDFRAWADSLPTTYWARYDLSAARIGWEAANKFILENAEVSHGDWARQPDTHQTHKQP